MKKFPKVFFYDSGKLMLIILVMEEFPKKYFLGFPGCNNNRKILQKQLNKRYIFYVWGSINQKILIMDNVFKYFNGFFKGLTGLIMTVLGLGVAVEILFGGGAMFGITVIDNVMNILNSLGGSGFAGLVGICVLFGLLRG